MASDPIPSDLAAFPRPSLAVDLVLLTICEGALRVLMMDRGEAPFAGQLVLPGGFVHERELLDDTARRVLADKVGLSGVGVEQLYTFSEPARDPRGWVVSVAYFALMPCGELLAAIDARQGLRLVTVEAGSGEGTGELSSGDGTTGEVRLRLDGEPSAAGFDHHLIVAMALQRLRGKLDWSMVAFGLLPEEFTLFELLRVHELILGRTLLKPVFRKKMLERTFADGRRLVPTGRWREGRHRPAELYRLEASDAQ